LPEKLSTLPSLSAESCFPFSSYASQPGRPVRNLIHSFSTLQKVMAGLNLPTPISASSSTRSTPAESCTPSMPTNSSSPLRPPKILTKHTPCEARRRLPLPHPRLPHRANRQARHSYGRPHPRRQRRSQSFQSHPADGALAFVDHDHSYNGRRSRVIPSRSSRNSFRRSNSRAFARSKATSTWTRASCPMRNAKAAPAS